MVSDKNSQNDHAMFLMLGKVEQVSVTIDVEKSSYFNFTHSFLNCILVGNTYIISTS